MANQAEGRSARRGFPWRAAGWGLAASLLLLPLAAMRFTDQVNWTVGDFVFAFLLVGAVGLAFELAASRTRDPAYRAGIALALAAAFLIVWVNGAVGMIGDEDNRYNLLFLGVIVLALAGAAAARFRAAGMALAMAAAALAQIVVALGSLAADPRGALFAAALAGPWLLAAAAFRRAARRRPPAAASYRQQAQ